MTASETDKDEAPRWATRLDTAPLAPEEQRALEAWLAADERHHGALLRAEAALAYLDRGRALAEPPPGLAEPRSPRFGRRTILAAGGAFCGLAAVGLAGVLLLTTQTTEFSTVVGEVRRVPLADGSFASLNTASRVGVSIGEAGRHVRLKSGEAWFQVAHDPNRPFIVEAGEIRVQAIGTAFSVRLRGAGADVLVTEGVVETWVVGREAERARIPAGARGFITQAAPRIEVVQAPETVDRALAWRVGDIALNGESLGYAAAEINRYNRRRLIVEDAVLARQPLVGYFRTNEPENFARAVAGMIGAQVVDDGRDIRLVRRTP